MLHWAFIFLVLALIAAIFGFRGAASAFAGVAKLLVVLFLVLFLVAILL